ARRIHGVAVVLDIDAEPLVRFTMRERGAHRRGQTVTDAGATGSADELMMLAEGPETMRPVGEAGVARHERPVFVLDLLPDFGRETRRADRARVPRIGCGLREHALARLHLAFPGLLATLGDSRAAIHRYGLFDVLRQHGECRLRVRADGNIDRLIALEILIIRADVQVAHADADQPRPRLRPVDLRHLD